MCFRPPRLQKPVKCANCGKYNSSSRKTCSACHLELIPEEKNDQTPKENNQQ